MPVLKYRDPADGVYRVLSNKEEVTVSAFPPPVSTDLWVDTQDSTGGAPKGARNVIRNGDMSIAQRGNGPFGGGVYGIDGWTNDISGTIAVTRVPSAAGAGSNLLQAVIAGQSAQTNYAGVWSQYEDIGTLSGKTVTISFNAKVNTGTAKIGVAAYYYWGSGGSGTPAPGYYNLGTPTVTVNTILTRYSISFTMPIVSGTIGSGANLQVGLIFSAGTSVTWSTGIGLQNGTFSVTDVQLEEGSLATPFERLPIQQQLAWCQRYFQRYREPALRGVVEAGNPKLSRMGMHLLVPMRVVPTATMANTMNCWDGMTGVMVSSIQGAFCSEFAMEFDMLPITSASNVGNAATIAHGGYTGYIDLSAEL